MAVPGSGSPAKWSEEDETMTRVTKSKICYFSDRYDTISEKMECAAVRQWPVNIMAVERFRQRRSAPAQTGETGGNEQ